MDLSDDLRRIADAAARRAAPGEEIAGIVPTEARAGSRSYLCAYRSGQATTWLVFDAEGNAVDDRSEVRAVVSIAALCELADEVAGGGDLDELRSRLVALRLTENPDGIEEAEAALDSLQVTIGSPPRLATPQHLDAVGAATLRLEKVLGSDGGSPFAATMKQATATVEELTRDVEGAYKVPLRG